MNVCDTCLQHEQLLNGVFSERAPSNLITDTADSAIKLTLHFEWYTSGPSNGADDGAQPATRAFCSIAPHKESPVDQAVYNSWATYYLY